MTGGARCEAPPVHPTATDIKIAATPRRPGRFVNIGGMVTLHTRYALGGTLRRPAPRSIEADYRSNCGQYEVALALRRATIAASWLARRLGRSFWPARPPRVSPRLAGS